MSLDISICAYFVNNIKPGTGDAAGNSVREAAFDNALSLMRSQLADSQIRQIKPNEGFTLISSGSLTKKDVFVLAQFQGDFFDQLQATKALVVGPPCIVNCLTKCEPIPMGNTPIYTTAMRDLQVSATGLSAQEKDEVARLVHWMGGNYFHNFGRTITHLIANTIKSNKYEHATVNGVPVMHLEWVRGVWERSIANSNIRAADEEFDKYRLPVFFGANITCSGLDVALRDKLMQLINDNGGIYHRAFRSQHVDIVITEQTKTDSDKYKAAVRFNKDVLLPKWIFDSHERGFALPTKGYEVRPRKQMSTPTKQRETTISSSISNQTQLSDLSRINFVSDARRMGSDMTTVNETMSSVHSTAASSPAKELLKQATTGSTVAMNYHQVLKEICPREAKQAGAFLDGCCIYLSGFRAEEREKLNRVLNTGGATRYDEVKEGLTHILVGKLEDAQCRQWQCDGMHVVRLQWLLECIRAKRIVSESIYRISLPNREPDVASPASKRTLRSMNHSFKQPEAPIKKKLFDEPDEHLLLTHYSQENEPPAALPSIIMNPAASSTQLEAGGETVVAPPPAPPPPAAVAAADLSASVMSIDFDKLDYFMGASVYVHKESFSEEIYTDMLNECIGAKGNVVMETFEDPVDYAIVSFESTCDVASLPVKARHVVTELYVENCMKQNRLLPMEYFHHPIPHTADTKPLMGMVIVVSIYAGLERDYINSVATLLGASVNKTFIKKDKPLLVCPKAEGCKYNGAIKWSYPVVHADWLVQCAKRGQKLPYRAFIVGNSVTDFPKKRASSSSSSSSSSAAVAAAASSSSVKSDANITLTNTSTTMTSNDNNNEIIAPVAAATVAEVTPLRNKRVSELVHPQPNARRSCGGGSSGDSDSAGSSPRTPLTQMAFRFDFLDRFADSLETEQSRDCIREIIREMRENQTPELERIRRLAATPINRRGQQQQQQLPTPGIPEFCRTPAFQQRMVDDFERRWRLPIQPVTPDTPIDVIRQRVLRITCETLGIPYEDNHSDVAMKIVPPVAAAAAAAAAPPSTPKPSTPLQNSRPRTLFNQTPTQTETSQNCYVPCSQSPMATRNSTIDFDKISFEETGQATIAANATSNTSTTTTTRKPTTDSPEFKQIADYLKSCESRRNSLKRNHSRTHSKAPTEGAGTTDGYMESEVQYVQPFESEGFALGTEEMVGWRDPAEFNAAKRRSTGSPRMQHQGMPKFSISCANDDKRTEIINKIHQLGGEVCENLSSYDHSCTHLLCERPNRGEKLLGCIAAGKWVLDIKYIEECHARNAFTNEELYEWGNPRAVNMSALAEQEQVIANAAHRWRTQLQSQSSSQSSNERRVGVGVGVGAFDKFTCILSLQPRNMEAIMKVLRAGNGKIVQPRSPFSEDASAGAATHCFVDIKKAPLASCDFKYLEQRGVRILSQMYIHAYLMSGEEADLESHTLRNSK